MFDLHISKWRSFDQSFLDLKLIQYSRQISILTNIIVDKNDICQMRHLGTVVGSPSADNAC